MLYLVFTFIVKINYELLIKLLILGSKRSAHSNAYFYGFFKSKRIVLYDTLFKENKDTKDKISEDDKKPLIDNEVEQLEINKNNDEAIKEKEINENKDEQVEETGKGMNEEEILAVLCHELGHWKLNHILFNIVICQV